jgi:hypothetical protein
MTYDADLTGAGRVRNIGYLARGHSYPKGTTSEAFFDHLVELVERPLGAWAGYHTCDLGWCRLRLTLHPPQPTFRYKGRVLGLGDIDIFVPGDEVVYYAPSLILHYIRRHKYAPPPCFVDAVLKCPDPRSQEYCDAIKRIAPEMSHFFGLPDGILAQCNARWNLPRKSAQSRKSL